MFNLQWSPRKRAWVVAVVVGCGAIGSLEIAVAGKDDAPFPYDPKARFSYKSALSACEAAREDPDRIDRHKRSYGGHREALLRLDARTFKDESLLACDDLVGLDPKLVETLAAYHANALQDRAHRETMKKYVYACSTLRTCKSNKYCHEAQLQGIAESKKRIADENIPLTGWYEYEMLKNEELPKSVARWMAWCDQIVEKTVPTNKALIAKTEKERAEKAKRQEAESAARYGKRKKIAKKLGGDKKRVLLKEISFPDWCGFTTCDSFETLLKSKNWGWSYKEISGQYDCTINYKFKGKKLLDKQVDGRNCDRFKK